MRRRIAVGLVLAAVASGALAWKHWNTGIPPTWSYFGARASTEVLVSKLVERPDRAGGRRNHAHVEVAWPPGSTDPRPLPGVEPHHVPKMVWTPAQVVRSYPVGQMANVRVIGGSPFADLTDMTEMAYAIFFSIAAIGGLVGSIILMRGPAAPEPTEDET